jgi:hypothetical protein
LRDQQNVCRNEVVLAGSRRAGRSRLCCSALLLLAVQFGKALLALAAGAWLVLALREEHPNE